MSYGTMPAFLEPISLRLSTIRGWRDFQRFLAASPDQEQGWRRHLRVRVSLPDRKTPVESLALEVADDEANPEDDLPRSVFVLLDDGTERACAVRDLEAIGVVW
jgi:hypothetical protein